MYGDFFFKSCKYKYLHNSVLPLDPQSKILALWPLIEKGWYFWSALRGAVSVSPGLPVLRDSPGTSCGAQTWNCLLA